MLTQNTRGDISVGSWARPYGFTCWHEMDRPPINPKSRDKLNKFYLNERDQPTLWAIVNRVTVAQGAD